MCVDSLEKRNDGATDEVASPAGSDLAEPACPYCGVSGGGLAHRDVRDRLGYVAGAWSFRRCAGCGSLRLDPMPRAEDLAGFYPQAYSYAPELAGRGLARRWLSAFEHQFLYRALYWSDARRLARNVGHASGSGKRLLDVGCGRGLRLRSLRRMGYQVAGMDFDPESVRYVQEALGVPAVCCNACDLEDSFSASSFDVVTAFHLLEHVVDPAGQVKQCLRLLKPGGWLVFAVPLADSVQARLCGDRWCAVREAPRHVTIPSRAGMTALAKDCGCDSAFLVPQSAWNNAAIMALTLVPAAATTNVFATGGMRAFAARCLGTIAAVAALPWCWLENVLFRLPASGLFFMRKAEENT